jgi:hypothetical protein
MDFRANINDEDEEDSDIVDLTDSMVILEEHSTPPLNSLVYDVLFRPTEIEDVPMWDQFSLYEKIRKMKGKKNQDEEDTDGELEDVIGTQTHFYFVEIPENLEGVSCTEFEFSTGHPQKHTHVLRKRKVSHIPVLSGSPIPRRDLENYAEKYAVVMLALFRPWNRSATNPLKPETTSWKNALGNLLVSLLQSNIEIMDHMQEQWECRLAADKFSAQYKARQANFNTSDHISSRLDAMNELAGDLDWQLGQLDQAIGAEYNPDAPDTNDFEEFFEACGMRTKLATDAAIALAGAANFYHIPVTPDNIGDLLGGRAVESQDGAAHARANAATLLIAEEKSLAVSNRARQGT